MPRRRVIDASEQDWLDESEAARLLGVRVKVFARLVKEGYLPQGGIFGVRTRKWRWDVVYAMSVLMPHLMGLAVGAGLFAPGKPKRETRTGDKGAAN
jgi:hypothetical protein